MRSIQTILSHIKFFDVRKILYRGKKISGAKIRFQNPEKKFLEQRFDFRIRRKNFWSKDSISESGEKISGAKIRFQNPKKKFHGAMIMRKLAQAFERCQGVIPKVSLRDKGLSQK